MASLTKRHPATYLNLFISPISLIVIGILIMSSGLRFPEYRDPNWELPFKDSNWTNRLHTAFDDATHGHRQSFEALADEWFAAKEKAQTPRDNRIDMGMGFIALGISIGVLLGPKRAWSLRHLAILTTPRTYVRFYALAAMTWLSFIPAEWCWYSYTGDRGDYPWFGDVVFIPQVETFIFVAICLPFILFGVWIAIHGAKLPLTVWSGPVFDRFYILSLMLWGAAIMAAALIIYGVMARPYDVPTGVFMLYLILSGRAAAASRNAVPLPVPITG